MATLERVLKALLIALVAWLPFEFRSFPVLSNLQWLFIAVALAGLPIVIRERKRLLHVRLVIAAGVVRVRGGGGSIRRHGLQRLRCTLCFSRSRVLRQ